MNDKAIDLNTPTSTAPTPLMARATGKGDISAAQVQMIAAMVRMADAASDAANLHNGEQGFGRFNHLVSALAANTDRYLASPSADALKRVASSAEQFRLYAEQVRVTEGMGTQIGAVNALLHQTGAFEEKHAAIAEIRSV